MDRQTDWVHEVNIGAGYYSATANKLRELCGGLAKQAGWDSAPLDIPRSLMLTVSELGEAMEGDRKKLQDDHLPHHKMFDVELADAVIRIMHLYNTQRADHKKEVREAQGGKTY